MDIVIENYVWFIVGTIIILMTLIGYFAEKTDFGRKGEKAKKDKKKKKVEPTIKDEMPSIPSIEEQSQVNPNLNGFMEQNVLEQPILSNENLNAPLYQEPFTRNVNENYGQPPLETNQASRIEEDLNVPLGDYTTVSEQSKPIPKAPKPVYPTSIKEELNMSLQNESMNVANQSLNDPLYSMSYDEPSMINKEEDLNVPLSDTAYARIEEDLNVPLSNFEQPMQPRHAETALQYDQEPLERRYDIPNIEENRSQELELPDIDTLQTDTMSIIDEDDDDIWKF